VGGQEVSGQQVVCLGGQVLVTARAGDREHLLVQRASLVQVAVKA
jgi:hypothetical protein